MRKLAIWILVMILLVGTVNALGVTPGRQTVNFEPGLEKEVVLKILNSAEKGAAITLGVDGDLAPYIALNETKFIFDENDKERYVSYRLKLPQSFEDPGLHTARITVNEVPDQIDGELMIGALVSVASQVHVEVPYPDKYVDAEFNVLTEEGKAKLHIFIKSLGEDPLEEIKGTIIVEKDGEEVFSKEISLGGLTKFERTEMYEILKLDAGDYVAKAIVDFDGEELTFEKEFTVGTLINALGISVNPNFNIGDVARFGILVENGHVDDIKSVIARILLKDDSGSVVADERSVGLDLRSGQQSTSNVYWDTADVSVGSYGGTLFLSYNDKTVEKPVRINLFTDRIEASFTSITGFVVAEQPIRTDKVVLIPLLIGIIIMLVLIIVTLLKGRRRYEGE